MKASNGIYLFVTEGTYDFLGDHYNTTTSALAATIGIKARRNRAYSVKSLQEYHAGIK